jgi:FMN reductase
MPTVLLLSGSPSESSKSATLLKLAQWILTAEGIDAPFVSVRDFPAEDLILGKYDSPAFEPLKKQIAAAAALIVSTPIYKAAYTGALKALLDILPPAALAGKVVLPIATGGSSAHLLAIEYALKPVLSTLGATDLLQGVYVVDKELTLGQDGAPVLADELRDRFDRAIRDLARRVKSRSLVAV